MKPVIWVVGFCASEAEYQSLMFKDKTGRGYSITQWYGARLPAGTRLLVTRHDRDLAAQARAAFPGEEPVWVGHSLGAAAVLLACRQLAPQIFGRVILLDPVHPAHAAGPNTAGLTAPSNIRELYCIYRQAKAWPWSAPVTAVEVARCAAPGSTVTNLQTTVTNLLYLPARPNDEPAAHGQEVWNPRTVELIKAELWAE